MVYVAKVGFEPILTDAVRYINWCEARMSAITRGKDGLGRALRNFLLFLEDRLLNSRAASASLQDRLLTEKLFPR